MRAAKALLITAAVMFGGSAVAAENEIRPVGPPIVLEAGSGTLVQASAPVSNLFIADDTVADVHIHRVAGKDLVFVYGKKPGKTTLYAVADDGHVMVNNFVQVSHTVVVHHGFKKREVWSSPDNVVEAAGGGSSAEPEPEPQRTTTVLAVQSTPAAPQK